MKNEQLNEDTMYTGKSSRNPYKPLITAVFGVVFIAFGVYLYYDLAAWELTNEEKNLHHLLWSLYDLGGKLAVSGVFVGFGVLSIGVGIFKTAQLKKLKKEAVYFF